MRDFNFFAPYIGKNKSDKNKNLYIRITAVVVVGFIGATLLWNSISLLMLNRDIKNLNSELNKPDKVEKLRQAEILNNKQEILNKYYAGLENIFTDVENRNRISSELMADLSSTMPKGVSFKSMNLDGQTIQIQGEAGSRVAIAELQHNLKQLEFVAEVSVSTINDGSGSGSQGAYSFALKCTLKDVEKNEDK